MPESSQQHIKIERICFDCGDLLHGLNCLECDLTRKILEKAFQKFQNTSKSSNDNSNVVNAPREPFVVKQDPSVNSSQKSPLIDQKCCCECGDSLDGIFCQRCTSMQKKEEEKRIAEEQAAKERYWKIPIYSFSSKDCRVCEASPPNSEPVSSKVWRIVIPEVGRLRMGHSLIKDDTLREKLLNVNRLVAKIKALKDNPVPSSVVVTKSTSTFPNLFLEETNTFDNSFPESETFSFNLEEISSGSPTTHSELSLPDYKAFTLIDHFKEKSSGSTTTHVDFSQYDSFIFDLSNDQFPPADRSDFYHEEFADELAQIISQPEYDCFFKDEPELGNFTMDVVGNIFQTKEPRVHVLLVCPPCVVRFHSSSESHFRFCCMELSPFLFIPVIPLISSCGDEDTILIPALQSILSSSDVSIGIARICEDSRSGYHQKDRKPSQNDKTEHGMEKTVQNQGQIVFRPTGYSISKDPEVEQIKEEPLEEPKEEGQLEESEEKADSDLLSDARSRPGPAKSSDSYESKFKPKRGPAYSKEDHDVHLKLVLELLKKEKLFAYKIHYHPRKVNVVADALSEASKVENATAEMLRGLDQLTEMKEDGGMYFIWVPLIGDVRTLIMDEDHALSMEKLERLYIGEIVARHKVPVSIILDRDGRFTSRVLENITESLRDSTGYEYGLSSSEGGQKTIDKVILIKERLKAARDCQNSYVGNMRKLIGFEVGDKVILEVSSWKG
ncbi:hypothetical protein Tco_1509232, partial [Tanacetum coccineum]